MFGPDCIGTHHRDCCWCWCCLDRGHGEQDLAAVVVAGLVVAVPLLAGPGCRGGGVPDDVLTPETKMVILRTEIIGLHSQCTRF